jgi:hypothetical protein
MNYKVRQVEAVRYPVLRITFEDGISGEIDLADQIERSHLFAPLRDASCFAQVALADGGRRFGWRLDEPGCEIDLDPDAARIAIETEAVERLAARFAAGRSAAE